MLKGLALLALGVAFVMILPAGALGNWATPTAPPAASPSGAETAVALSASGPTTATDADPVPNDGGGGAPPHSSSASANISLVNVSHAKHISWSFWGVNVAAQQNFRSSDATAISETPVSFVRFPGGILGEQLNFTSGIITNDDGTTMHAGTSIAQFVTSCNVTACHAILQLPAEIDQPQTAAYYADYVVNTLHFQPAYWEIGNSVPGWVHFQTPWSQWKTTGGAKITSTGFAKVVGQYITAVKKVDSKARFIALGAAMGTPQYAKSWVSELALVDGHNLSGISVHSYTMGGAPTNPTWPELLANLNGQYSLPDQVSADRGYITAECPKCDLKLFITEANGAEHSAYTNLLSTFAGELYLAADTTQALNLRLTNVDWFCYQCHYGGAWSTSPGHWQMQYTLFSQMFPGLQHSTLSTTVTGPPTFYAAATYGHTNGLALMMVNTNTTTSVSVGLGLTGIIPLSVVHLRQWLNGSSGPTNSTITIGTSLTLPALSISILTVGPSDLGLGPSPAPKTVAHDFDRPAHQSGTASTASFLTGPTCSAPVNSVSGTPSFGLGAPFLSMETSREMRLFG